jgi:predicted signal transduction protein with EAL and GGDEF domain
MKHFYVYYSYEEYGRGYIGKRECKCLPEQDIKYFGSYKDKTFKPTQKIILETFENVEKALEAECALHDFYKIDKNPHFANRAKQTSTGFYYNPPKGENNPAKSPEVRKKLTEEQRQKVRERKVERDNKTWMMKDPAGKMHTANNLKYFCEKNNLSDSAMHHVISGKRKQHKGWTRA